MEKKVALYIRFSSDDNKELNATSSIDNQKNLLTDYAKNNGFIIYDTYVDKGYTGTNFERPAFKRLINDMYLKKFSIIIVKDRSRLSRNYIELSKYDEVIFPQNNIRLISVSENYDSLNNNESSILSKQITDVFNTFYSKDLKNKIRKYYQIKAKKSKIIKIPKYGYLKKDKKLVIDEESANVVRQIFEYANKGLKPTEIANELKARKIYCPSFYKAFVLNTIINRKMSDVIKEPYNWCSATITAILKDYEYCGHTINIVQKNAVNEEKRILIKNTHPAIISEEVFSKTPKKFICHKTNNENFIYKQFYFCKRCRRTLSFSVRKESSNVFYCPVCLNKVDYDKIEGIVFSDLLKLINFNYAKECNLINQMLLDNSPEKEAQKKIDIINEKTYKLLSDKTKEIISENEFQKELLSLSKEKEECKAYENNREDILTFENAKKSFAEFIARIKESKLSKPELIRKFVSKCEIEFIDKEKIDVKIYYKYKQ